MGQLPNPNWPLTAVELDATVGPPSVPGASRVSLESRGMAVQDVSVTRGVQYELAHAEAGTCTVSVSDPNEILNPGNAASPLNTGGNTILPYRALRFSALWNPATLNQSGNILNSTNPIPGQANTAWPNGYDPSFESWYPGAFTITADGSGVSFVTSQPSGALNSNTTFESGISPWAVSGGTVVQSSTQKHSGSFAAKLTPNGTSSNINLMAEQVPVVAGNAYCATAWVSFTSAVTGNASAGINWFDASHTYISTSNTFVSAPAGAWTQLQQTVNAPAGAAFAALVPTLASTPPATNIWYLDDASLTNATNPADGPYLVAKVSLTASNSFLGWSPRVTPGVSYTFTVDVYAPTSSTVTLSYGGASTSTTATGAYQTLSLTATAAAGTLLQLTASTTAAYPVTLYFANYGARGLVPGWSQTSGASMSYTKAQAHSGLYSLGATLNAATDSISVPLPTVPGIIYTVSAWVLPSAGNAVQMSAGGTTATSTTANTWQRLTATFTATDAITTAAWKVPSGTYPVSMWLDDIQLECAQTASAYTANGPRIYPLFTGYVERYPSTWVDAGFRAIRPLVAVAAEGILSRTMINQSYQKTIMADRPSVLIPYNDKAIPQAVITAQGGPAIQGLQLVGPSGSVNFGGDSFLDSSPVVSVVQQNTYPPVTANSSYSTTLETQNGSTLLDRDSFAVECWIRWSAGEIVFGAGFFAVGAPLGATGRVVNGAYWSENQGQLTYRFSSMGGAIRSDLWVTINGQPYTPDGQWHYLVLSSSGGNTLNSFVDGAPSGSYNYFSPPGKINNVTDFFALAKSYYGPPVSQFAIANMALYSSALSSQQMQTHYSRGIGYIGELLGARAGRVLSQYWGSAYNAAPGRVGLAPDHGYNGRSVLDVLTEAADTEGGRVYADASGVVQVEDRASRYASQTAAVVFGENTAAGEIPYEAVEYDYDPTYVFSQVNLSRPGNSNYPPQVNATSQANFGSRILSQSLQVNNDFDLGQAGNFYLTRYGTPKQRIRRLVINPATYPKAWGAVLGLEEGTRVTATRRTAAGAVLSADYYVDQIRHIVSAPSHTWSVELQLSPVWVPRAFVLSDSSYGVLGAAAGNAVIY